MSKFEFTYSGKPLIVAVGGGITTDLIIRTMRRPYHGAIACTGFTPDQIPAGDGPTRFVQCQRAHLTDIGKATAREVLEDHWTTAGAVTYEAGLRWMLTDPNGAVERGSVAVIPPEPIVVDGKPHALVFGRGGESPRISLRPVTLERPWPADWDLLHVLNVEPFPSARR